MIEVLSWLCSGLLGEYTENYYAITWWDFEDDFSWLVKVFIDNE